MSWFSTSAGNIAGAERGPGRRCSVVAALGGGCEAGALRAHACIQAAMPWCMSNARPSPPGVAAHGAKRNAS
jgi:hypothetical protein